MEAGAEVTRRAALVRFGGALAGGMMASACGTLRAGNAAGASGSPGAAGTPELLWQRQANGAVTLAVSGDTLILGTEALIGLPGSHAVNRDDVVLALDGRTGARKWMSRLPPMATAMAVAGGVVYAGSAPGPQSRSGEVVALDGATGASRWSARVGAPVAALAVTGGVVVGCWDLLVMGAQPLMFGLDAVDGRILWQRDLSVLATIAAADGLVFASTVASGELLAVDALTGKLLWKRTGVEQYPSAPT